jgi:acyl-CoA synthetase (AMP-forming)/AMP-acid ligase II
VDQAGELLPTGEVGEIVTRGDQVFDEYFNDPEETARAFSLSDGWLLTGDVGFLDEEGFLTLVDRSKDMLVSGGENVYPAEIENALYEHDAVAECAVFGIPDERWGEVPAAHVVLLPGARVAEDELIDFCTHRIARFKRPRLIKFTDKLPKTPVGKIQKNELREPYWAGRDKNI